VDPLEWCFDSCPDYELTHCYWHHWTRLLRKRYPELETEVLRLRQKAADPTSFDSLAPVALDLVGPANAIYRQLVATPEWPKNTWLSIDVDERKRRLKILSPGFYPPSETWAKDILPARLPVDFMARLQAAIRAYELPIIPIGKGCWSISEVGLMKLKGIPIDWSNLLPAPGETIQSFLAVLLLHWPRSNPDLSISFNRLLEMIRPPNIAQDAMPTGKNVDTAITRYDLKCLGAFYLRRELGLTLAQAKHVSAAHLKTGSLFTEKTGWRKAVEQFECRLREKLPGPPVQVGR
jgi:hypothetical protein